MVIFVVLYYMVLLCNPVIQSAKHITHKCFFFLLKMDNQHNHIYIVGL